MRTVRLDTHEIGHGSPCFLIAEAGVNHNGRLDLAKKMAKAAADAHADAVKFQSFVPEQLVTQQAPKADYQLATTGTGTQVEMLRRVALEADEQRELKAYCDEIGILYLCTPYEEASLTQLISMDVPALKIASTDTTNVPFLRSVARAGIPVILSTGMCTLGEVERAVREFRLAGTDDRVVLMHCVSQYPAPAAEAGLGCIDTLQRAFGLPTGYSDHVQGNDIALCSVAAGACAVEKHFTLDRSMEGPDHRASSTPPELADLVSRIRTLEAAIGDGYKQPMPSELANKPRMQKSLVARESISAGDVITARNLTTKRPATGMLPYMFDEVVGRTAAVTIPEDTTLTYEMVDWNNA